VSPDRRHARHLATRREILDHAWDIARREGLAALSLSELARRMQMRTPSLYTYFNSKNAVYDAMFAEAATAHLELLRNLELPSDHSSALKVLSLAHVDFCTEDPARYQLLFQRTIPGFEPAPESYAPAIAALELTAEYLAEMGMHDRRHLDIMTAIATGFTDQQISNDPGGTRWRDLIEEIIDVLYHHLASVEARDT
jgi:AcrR family transcriptional regulator